MVTLLVLPLLAGCGTAKNVATVSMSGASHTTANDGTTGSGATGPNAGATASSVALTRAQFISDADRICQSGHVALVSQQANIDQALAADQKSDTQSNRLALTDALRVDADLSRSVLAKLRVSAARAGTGTAVSDYIAATARQTALLESFSTAVATGDASSLKLIANQLTRGKANLKVLAQAYGFKVCGTD
jgi:hypothetical protein